MSLRIEETSRPRSPAAVAALVLAALALAYWLFDRGEQERGEGPEDPVAAAEEAGRSYRGSSTAVGGGKIGLDDPAAIDRPEHAVANERLYRFRSEAEWLAFLEAARALAGVKVVSTIPGLNAVRLRFDDDAAERRARGELPRGAEEDFNYVVTTPEIPLEPEEPQGNTRPFGRSVLEFLGVPAEGKLGEGIIVAVLDTGVSAHATFDGRPVREVDLLEGPEGGEVYQGHGTAVASLIAGSGEILGVAPWAQVLSIRVLDGDGVGDTFTVAEGIVEAVDRGARVINLSLGSYGDSFVLEAAVDYAAENGVVVVASAGNDAVGQVTYPAAYESVIGVAAVDANGQRADFSNFGTGVDIAAPGVGVAAAWGEDRLISFSGTSTAAPLVAGAAVLLLAEEPGLDAAGVMEALGASADDGGQPGPDPRLGEGVLNVDRAVNRNEPGIYDVAVADIYVHPEPVPGGPPVTVSVQNRGTEKVGAVKLMVDIDGRPELFPIGSMEVGEVQSRDLYIAPSELGPGGARVEARVVIDGREDAHPGNDGRASNIILVDPLAGPLP